MSTHGAGTPGYTHAKECIWTFMPYTKINSNWKNDLNVRAEIINFICTNLANLALGDSFLNVTPKG